MPSSDIVWHLASGASASPPMSAVFLFSFLCRGHPEQGLGESLRLSQGCLSLGVLCVCCAAHAAPTSSHSALSPGPGRMPGPALGWPEGEAGAWRSQDDVSSGKRMFVECLSCARPTVWDGPAPGSCLLPSPVCHGVWLVPCSFLSFAPCAGQCLAL